MFTNYHDIDHWKRFRSQGRAGYFGEYVGYLIPMGIMFVSGTPGICIRLPGLLEIEPSPQRDFRKYILPLLDKNRKPKQKVAHENDVIVNIPRGASWGSAS